MDLTSIDSRDMDTSTISSDQSVLHDAKCAMAFGSLRAEAIKTKGLFSLMELPTELRLKIYRHILISVEDINIPSAKSGENDISVSILRTCKLVNEEATPILYGSNTFIICLSMDPIDPIPPNPQEVPIPRFSLAQSFLLSRLRWSTLEYITHLSFISNSTSLPELYSQPPSRPCFTCTGMDIVARFTPRDLMYSPAGPDGFMALSVSNWISAQVMRAELSAFQRELEALMRPSEVETAIMTDDPASQDGV